MMRYRATDVPCLTFRDRKPCDPAECDHNDRPKIVVGQRLSAGLRGDYHGATLLLITRPAKRRTMSSRRSRPKSTRNRRSLFFFSRGFLVCAGSLAKRYKFHNSQSVCTVFGVTDFKEFTIATKSKDYLY